MGKTHPREYFVAGGIAGIVSRTAIAPIERVKILYQVSRAAAGTQQGWMQIAPNILRDEGVLAFWKGNTAAVVRVMPYMSLTFLTYEEYKVRLIEGGMPKQASTLAAGSAAGVTAVSVTYPLDLVRATMAKPGHTYSSMFDAMITIVRQRGVGGLYAGISATILGVAPYAGLKFVSYEGLKGVLGNFCGVSEAELRPWQRVASGLVAGMLAQTAVYPLDVVRRRMQMHEGAKGLYSSPLHALRTIAAEEGVRTVRTRSPRSATSRPPQLVPAACRRGSVTPLSQGLFRGLTLNYLKTMPNVAIYMSLYDIVKMRLVTPSPA